MANLFDYLEWRGDVPFSADPFNEVDNLMHCMIMIVSLVAAGALLCFLAGWRQKRKKMKVE